MGVFMGNNFIFTTNTGMFVKNANEFSRQLSRIQEKVSFTEGNNMNKRELSHFEESRIKSRLLWLKKFAAKQNAV